MEIFNKFSTLCLMLLLTLCFEQTAFAAKTLSLGTASVSNTGDDIARTVTMDVTLKGGANDVNGLAFTLIYNKDVFTFEGLAKNSMDIDDGANYDPDNPPSAQTIAATLFYQYNNKAAEGIVMIAAAAANFFTTNATADFVPFKVKFKAKLGAEAGNYPIEIQKTIIGPDTAANAGYTESTTLEVAAGLDPTKDPTTAQTYSVAFSSGLITVLTPPDITTTTTTVPVTTTTTTTTVPPAFIITATPFFGDAPLEVEFDIDGIDPDLIEYCQWDFDGDGEQDTQGLPPIIHTYQEPEIYTIGLNCQPYNDIQFELYTKIQVNTPPEVVIVEDVITGGDEESKYVPPVSDKFEATYVVNPNLSVVKIDQPSYTFNAVTNTQPGDTVVIDARRIDWAHAEVNNMIKQSFLAKGMQKPVPKPIISADTFTAPDSQTLPSAALTINLKTLTKDITVAVTPYKNQLQIPVADSLLSLGYILVTGADISVSDSLGNRLYWDELSDYSTLDVGLAAQKDLLSASDGISAAELHLFMFDNATLTWIEKSEAIIEEKNGLYKSKGYAANRLSPFMLVYKPATFSKTGTISGKVYSQLEKGINGAAVILYDPAGNPLGQKALTDQNGEFSLEFQIVDPSTKTYTARIFHYNAINPQGAAREIEIGAGTGQNLLLNDNKPIHLIMLNVNAAGYPLNLAAGWNLLALTVLPYDSTPGVLFYELSDTQSVWKWTEDKWAVWIPPSIMPVPDLKQYTANKGFQLLSGISYGEGFWVNTGGVGSIKLFGEPYVDDSFSMKKGWSLIGLKINDKIPVSGLIGDKSESVASAWKWDNSNWKVYLPGGGTETYSAAKGFGVFSLVAPGEGFWLNSTADFTLSTSQGIIEQVAVPIPGGTFTMGNQSGIGIENEEPVHQVTLSAFKMYKHEVTNEAYSLFVKDGGYSNKLYWTIDDGSVADPDVGWNYSQNLGWQAPLEWNLLDTPYWKNAVHSTQADTPVGGVSWYEAYAYSKWLSAKTGKTYRLPTEAEWEYAARGGLVGKKYPWGDDEPDGSYSNYGHPDDGYQYSAPVGSYQANGYGLQDMAGNHYEWSADWYDLYSSSLAVNPTGPVNGTDRVIRGSSYQIDLANSIRCSFRLNTPPGARHENVGLRCLIE